MTAGPRLRLVKVVVQAIFVADDGEHLQELVTDPIEVASSEWLSFPGHRFEELRAKAELELAGAGPPPGQGP